MSKGLIVIGDVHGEFESLYLLVSKVSGIWPDTPICLTGDLCDRGKRTKEVVHFCINRGIESVLGNHDVWLRKMMTTGRPDRDWLSQSNGGMATIDSYRTGKKGLVTFPEAHARWFVQMPLYKIFPDVLVDGRVVIVTHAPLGSPLNEIMTSSNWNIRHRSWVYDTPWQEQNFFGVCGHLMYPDPVRRGNVFYIDTGCGAGGALSAVKLPELETVSVGDASVIRKELIEISNTYPEDPSPKQRRMDALEAFSQLPFEGNV